jgi:hypothetical protein
MVLTLFLLVFLFFFFLEPLLSKKVNPSSPGQEIGVEETIRTARENLARGYFRQARIDLEHLLQKQIPPSGTKEERRVRQLAREAAVLSDLLAESLEEILQHAAGLEAKEWQLEFRHRYQGKAILLDGEFFKDAAGNWQCDYQLFAGKDKAKLEFSSLVLPPKLSLQGRQRMVLGLRLENVRLEPPGPAWVVRLEKNSEVFLTELGAARMVCPDLAEDEAQKLLALQATWIE